MLMSYGLRDHKHDKDNNRSTPSVLRWVILIYSLEYNINYSNIELNVTIDWFPKYR